MLPIFTYYTVLVCLIRIIKAILISPMPPEMAVIKELERGTLSMLSDLQIQAICNQSF
jgi:hypothetical protein